VGERMLSMDMGVRRWIRLGTFAGERGAGMVVARADRSDIP